MCLSNVYRNELKEENLLARNIADISIEGGKIILTDLMGIRKEISAVVRKIDLLENYVLIGEK